MSTSGSVGGAAVATVVLDSAAIGTLFTAPTEIIPAPGPNRAIFVENITMEAVPVTADGGWVLGSPWGLWYTVAGPPVAFLMSATPDMMTGTVTGTGNLVFLAAPSSSMVVTVDPTTVVDAPVVVGVSNANPTPLGPIATASVADGGALYVVGDTGTIAGDYALAATYEVLTVDGGGAVVTFAVTDPSGGYNPADSPFNTATDAPQPGIGTGFTVTVDTITPPAGTLYVTAQYRIFTPH